MNIESNITFKFDKPIGDKFNTYSISYSSNEHLCATAKYMNQGITKEETIYLEKGENRVFSSLIDGFLEGDEASGIYELTVSPLSAETSDFKLINISTSKREVPKEDVIFAENSRFKLGIMLKWGGGISYLEDLNDGDDTISNLLNFHDTGRLVQQSYYGINKEPYECGNYNGTIWGYNPVQGGNLYGEHSKLLDFKISDDGLSIYIKCQPRDWAKKGIYTPSYMENTYTVCDEYVKVNNRFIDFSGYTHIKRHQELPAFYTISFLSDFVFYDGENAWTDGELRAEKDLSFWAGNKDAYFDLKSKETWCAWCSDNGYGVGIYTSKATTLLAGRFQYNGSKSALDSATNYVAPLITYNLKSFTPFEYSYYMTAGDISSMRSVFKHLNNKKH